MPIARRCDAATVEAADVRDAVRAVRRGDRDAFGRLVERYERPLFGLALMMVRRPDGAEEVAQDAFIRAYLKLDHYDDSRPFYPWLATIAVRLAQNWLRRHTRIDRREGAEVDAERDAAPDPHPVSDMIASERDRCLWRAVAALPSGERTAVFLHYRQEMPVRDVAFALGVTSGTVKTLLFRARRRLRSLLDPAAHLKEHTS